MAKRKVNLVVSNDKKPLGAVKPGQKFEVVAVTLTPGKGSSLKPRLGARLCGGTSTCLALLDIDRGDPAP